ncbi:secretion system protein [Pseudomonas fluorescens]|uniref:secretion system protein n=1 Tax=Pseudomonas fluorescens TaxID=294 RepID=UPI0004CFBB6E|nr:secretion system protein [Pseudomonas fluorescens]
MTSCAERLRWILAEPLDYVHAERLHIPVGFEGPDARRALNRILLEGLELQGPWPMAPQTAVADLWVRQWRQLPYIAALLGAWRLFPQLARGGALQQLPASLRKFASCSVGSRAGLPVDLASAPMQQVEAAGFHALCGWSEHIPTLLLERLSLQFSPQVVDLHRQWPVAEPDTALLFLAVQHARLHPNPD